MSIKTPHMLAALEFAHNLFSRRGFRLKALAWWRRGIGVVTCPLLHLPKHIFYL